MRKISKEKEPGAWMEHRLTPGACFESIPELREALLKEQGYICAYCMRRIPVNPKEVNIDSKIEHITSQETCIKNGDKRELAYDNIVICCPGRLMNNSHCDDSKKSYDLQIDLFSEEINTAISYSSFDGSISCKANKDWDDEIDKILNLNLPILKENRKRTLLGVIQVLNMKKWTNSHIKSVKKTWESRDVQGKYREYYGIVVWFLNKKTNK